MSLVTTDWLEKNLKNVKILDATWHMPNSKKDALQEFFSKKLDGKIETNISEIKNYCKAEDYHQKYIMKRGR